MSDATLLHLPNRLAREKSPYLRQHAHNPVDWYPWGAEAFTKARTEQKPIFLSIGYSTCHWCHVMAHESFENPAIAERLNLDFVPVKVDREERPDLDRIYMTYVQAVSGHGGWPMSVWLTPDLKPFYGGTYFPPEDRWGRPGLATILTALTQAWANERDRLVAESERVVDALRQYSAGQEEIAEAPPARTGAEAEDELRSAASAAFDRCFQQLDESFDPAHGGFGGAPKFPRAAIFNFLFRAAAISGVDTEAGGAAAKLAVFTLRQMAEGGLHDHVGGGFHRYSIDEEWFVPHFEKMLYDQAQLAVSFLEAKQATGDERYAWVARGIFDYVLRDLAHPDGGFYSAEDADSSRMETPGEEAAHSAEGAFYVWTREEVEQALADHAPAVAELICAHFGVVDGGNVPEGRDPQGELRGKSILRQRQPLAATAAQLGLDLSTAADRLLSGLMRLREARARRPRPHLDDKIITAWNGLMISALAKGHQVLGAEDGRENARPGALLRAAVRAAEFLRGALYDEKTGKLYRSYREGRSDIPGFAEDYACLIQGLLDLYEASFEPRWLEWAEQLQAAMDAAFWDEAAGGYFNSRADDPTVIARMKEDYDGAEPAPSSVAANNLLRLAWMLTGAVAPAKSSPGQEAAARYRDRAMRCLQAFRRQWERVPHALPQMLCALEMAVQPPRTVVLAGGPATEGFQALTAVLHEQLRPRRVVLATVGSSVNGTESHSRWLRERLPQMAEMSLREGHAAAYVCEDFTCRPPVTAPAELRQLLG